MQKKNNYKYLILLTLMTCTVAINAQNDISSPYSGFGIGNSSDIKPGILQSMGGASYAMQNRLVVNYCNPASYVAFDSLSILIDASFSVVSSTLRTSGATQKNTFARPNYLLIGLPITPHWRTSVGLLPFSDQGYSIINSKTIDSVGKVNYTYSGSGGLYNLYWGNAFKIFKNFSLGLNLTYLFGSFSQVKSNTFEGTNFVNSRVEDYNKVNGLYISAGAQYFVNINKDHILGFGFVYKNSAYIATKRNFLASSYLLGENTEYVENLTAEDTLAFINRGKGRMIIPQSIGGGISYNFKEKVIVGVDATWQNWSKYRLNGNKDDKMKDALSFSAGIQFVPDPTSPKFAKRMSIRLGANYSTGYLRIDNTPIPEFNIAFGIGLPIRTFSTNASLNIMIEYGQMGVLQNDLIRQDVLKLTLNFSLQEKWYQRVKLD